MSGTGIADAALRAAYWHSICSFRRSLGDIRLTCMLLPDICCPGYSATRHSVLTSAMLLPGTFSSAGHSTQRAGAG
eukprot:1390148-Rhodomonas_salina.3